VVDFSSPEDWHYNSDYELKFFKKKEFYLCFSERSNKGNSGWG